MTKKEFIDFLYEKLNDASENEWRAEDENESIYLKGKIDAYKEILKALKN